MRDANGKSLFAVSDADLKSGRSDAQYDDTKFLSQEGEWFLAGVLDGLPDGTYYVEVLMLQLTATNTSSHAYGSSLS